METHRLALKAGYQIEQFSIEAVLGKGGFGITYVALDLQLGKRVAIKELLPDSIATRVDGSTVVPHSASLQENWEWARERFLDEARVLAGFSHPAIVGVHRLIEANGTVYMVMDYVDGESYEAKLRRIEREPDQSSLMAVIGPILDGMREVHERGLLHRDIKPENILINRRGQPVLIDFGSARTAVGATMTMTSIVTHGYSPIEQYQTKGRMGPWTDIYALGAVMCRAMTGEKPPVASDRIVDDHFRMLAARRVEGYSVTFLQAVDHALAVRSESRPQALAEWNLVPLSQNDFVRGVGPLASERPEPSSDSATESSSSSARPSVMRGVGRGLLARFGLAGLFSVIVALGFFVLAQRDTGVPFGKSGSPAGSSTATAQDEGTPPSAAAEEDKATESGNADLANIVRLERSESGTLNVVYREAADYPSSHNIEIWIEDPQDSKSRFKLAIFDRNASVFISPNDQWIALNVYPTSSGGGVQLYQRTKTADGAIHFAIAEPFLSRKTELQDEVWDFYLRQTARSPSSDRNHVNISAVGWEESSQVRIVVSCFGSNEDDSVPTPWKCAYDVDKRVFLLASIAVPAPQTGVANGDAHQAPPPYGRVQNSGQASSSLITEFVKTRHALEQRRQLDSIMALYGDKVRYFDSGEVSRAFIEDDKAKYFVRWPKASSRLVGEIQVAKHGPVWRVSFREDFRVENPRDGTRVTGSVEVTYEVAEKDGRLQIVGEDGKVLSRKSN